jgi:hypothetical protein
MGFKIRTPCNKEHGVEVSQVHILVPRVSQNDYTNIFMKMFLSIFKKKILQHFLKKSKFNFPPLLHLWWRQRHTHTHIISNKVKYINYYNCSKWSEVPRIDHGQRQQGMCNHTLLDLALLLSYRAQEHQSRTHSVESPKHFRQKYVFMRNYSFNANDLTWDKICLCMYDF